MINKIKQLKELALRQHCSCEDYWYSCPKSEEGCANEEEGSECNCGADKHNTDVEMLFEEIINDRTIPSKI